jgi:DNA (cytosine-5)-methyltransferase 1
MRISTLARPTFIDLFSGCGGLSLGLLNSGWEGLLAVERDKFAFSTFKANLIQGTKCPQFNWLPDLPAKEMTIGTFLKKLRNDAKLYKRLHGVDLITGGPPCQGFSFAGKRHHDDPRNVLFRDYLKVVALLRPKLLLIENVKGITVAHTRNNVPFAERIRRALGRLDYEAFADVHRASEFGVPQERPRYVLIAIDRRQIPDLNVSILETAIQVAISGARRAFLQKNGLAGSAVVSVQDAISDLSSRRHLLELCPDAPGRMQIQYRPPTTPSAYQMCLRRNAPIKMNSMRLAKHSEQVKKKFERLIESCKVNDRRGVALSANELVPLKTKKRNVVVLDPAKPSHTLTTLPDDLLHYDEPRILTVREYARLQSFPDWFEFRGKYTTGGKMRRKECPRYTQVGNAVAPFVAEVLGLALYGLARTLFTRFRPNHAESVVGEHTVMMS